MMSSRPIPAGSFPTGIVQDLAPRAGLKAYATSHRAADLTVQRTQQSQCGTRVVSLPIFTMLGIVGEMFLRWIGVRAHAVEWQWLDALRKRRVCVGILGPAVDEQEKITPPSRRQRRKR